MTRQSPQSQVRSVHEGGLLVSQGTDGMDELTVRRISLGQTSAGRLLRAHGALAPELGHLRVDAGGDSGSIRL